MALRFLPPPQGTGDNLPRPGLKHDKGQMYLGGLWEASRARALPRPYGLKEYPQYSLRTLRTVETKGGERTHRSL